MWHTAGVAVANPVFAECHSEGERRDVSPPVLSGWPSLAESQSVGSAGVTSVPLEKAVTRTTRTVLEHAVIGLMERRAGPPPPTDEREKEIDIDLAAGEYEAE